jgi:nucleoid DNA-binding protein
VREGKVVSIQGFGNFELKEKAERKIYSPSTKSFNIIPSKRVINYKMSPVLKDRINTL